MSDNALINRIRDDKALRRLWDSLTTEQKRKVLGFAEGDEGLAQLALQEAKDND